MDFNLFSEKMRAALEDYYGVDYNIGIVKVNKNNDIVLTGLNIKKKDSLISPTVYLEEPYEAYRQGMSFSEVFKEIIHAYEGRNVEDMFDLDSLINFDMVKSKIAYRLVSAENNSMLLNDMPYLPFLDMAVIFYYSVNYDETGIATVLVKNDLAERWNVNAEDLMRIAAENTPRIMKADISDMREAIFGVIENEDDIPDEISLVGRSMYIMTNNHKLFGAATIMYPGLLKDIAKDFKSNIYVLPSSIHEVILVPEKPGMKANNFRRIVMDVNRTQVDPLEVLSDSVYYYDSEKEELLVAG